MSSSNKRPDTKKKAPAGKSGPDSSGRIAAVMKSEVTRFIIGILSLLFGFYMILAFISFFFTGGNDQSILHHLNDGELLETGNRIQNLMGARGAQISEYLINDCFGFASFCIVIFLMVAGMSLMKAYRFTLWKWFIGCTAVMVWMSVTLAFLFTPIFDDTFIYPGGHHGLNVCRWACSQVGEPGLGLVLLALAIVIAIFFTRATMQAVRNVLHPKIVRKQKDENPEAETTNDTQTAEDTPSQQSETEKKDDEAPDSTFPIELSIDDDANETHDSTDSQETEVVAGGDSESLADNSEPTFVISTEVKDEETVGSLSQPYNPRLDLENYRFPDLNLLNSYDDSSTAIDMEEQNANKDRIIQVLRSFSIEISSIKASVGPTITLYEITPAEGIRISKIRNLEDDIALSLSALGIRIIAPIPGKGTIGIEVPNANPRIVPMAQVLASKKFQETTFELPLALGKTITNEVFMVDLAKAPHMLVAGATGQGKSVGLNAIVTSLLYKKHPSELKLVIIDPKKVEFAIYAPIERHYLAKLPDGEDAIITDVTKVVQTLNSLCVEMDTRYDLLKRAGCRNLKEYNAKFISRQLNPENGHHFLPYIVIIIDEFGDLIMTAGKEIELPICRIAQLARAVGIHAIIATQRPTTNIITGTIKANFPARVAFRVASMMDSRTILDRSGAQQLIGKGDMLYLQGSEPVRVQCAFVDTPEVERIVDFISRQQGYPTAFMLPEYVDPNADPDSGSSDVDLTHLDPLFEEAARLLIYHQQGSTSLIQRKFSIGYNRAGRLMDQLEKAGIVGPANGSKARDILCMDEADLNIKLQNLRQ